MLVMLSHWRLKSSLTCYVTFWAALTSWTVACVDRQHVSSYLKYVDLVTFDILLWFDLIIEPCSCQDVNMSDTHVTYSLLSRMRILDISGDGDNTLEFLLLSWCKSWWNSSRRILIHHENQTETLFVQKSTRKCPIDASFLSQSKWNFQHNYQQLVVLLAS